MLTHIYTHIYTSCVRACVHIPGETLKCAAERANTHACPSRVGRWTPSPSLPLFFCLSPFLTFAFPPAHPLAHSTRVRTLRDVRVCQWNTLSLSGGRQKGGRGGERGVGGGTVPGNSGSRSGAGGGELLSRWLLVAHWRYTEAFDLSLLSLSLSSSISRLTSSFSVSSFNSSFPSNSSGSLFLHYTGPHLVPSARLYSPCVDCKSVHRRTPIEIRATPPSTLSTLCLLVWFRPRPPSFPPTPRYLPMLPFLSSTVPPFSIPCCSRRCSLLRPAFISQQNLRDYSGRRR